MKKLPPGEILVPINLLLLAILGSGGFLLARKPDWAIGLASGAALGALHFWLIGVTARRAVDMEPSRAGVYTGITYLVRFIGTIAVLILLALAPGVNFMGAAIGIFLLRVAIFITVAMGGLKDPPADGGENA